MRPDEMTRDATIKRGGPQLIPRPDNAVPGDPAPWSTIPPDERRFDLEHIVAKFLEAPERESLELTKGIRGAAVLVALFEEDGESHVLLTRRAQHLRAHKGEVCFPGGRRDGNEALVDTALREAQEEIGLDPSSVEVIREWHHHATITSQSFIAPFIGVLAERPRNLVANPHEVEHILHVPLRELALEEVYREERWAFGGTTRPLWFFDLVGDTIWGATGALLRQFLMVSLGIALDHLSLIPTLNSSASDSLDSLAGD